MLVSTLQQGPTASQQETQNQQGHNHRHRPSPRPGPGQDQGHATSSGSNKRKISSKAFTPPSDGQQHKQQQPSPSKYIEFEHAIEHSTRKARHQDDTKRTFTENGHQRHLKRPLNSQYGNSGSHGATRLVQDKEARLGNRDSSLQDFENISSSDRPSQEREQFSHQPPNNTGRHRGISPVSNAGTRQRPDATRDRLRPGYHGEQAKVFSARSALPSNGPSESGTQSWSRLHQPPVTSVKKNEVLTIRDILDSQEIRDQISELRRSLNSNTDRRDPRASSRQNDYLNGSRIYEDLSSATSAPAAESRPSRTEQRWDEPARHGVAQTTSQGDGTATDLSMDKSLLEKKFRKRLDAVIPIMETPRTGLSGITIPVGQSSKKARTSTVAIPTEADANKREVGARKHRQDLYHSSYSPTEFSDVEDLDDNEDEDEDEDQDTVELIRHDTNDNHDGRSHPPPSQTQPTASQTHVREGLWASSSITHRYKPSSRPFQTKEGGDVDPGRDSGEISFEREVALARARRELGASLNHEGTQGESQAKPDSINPSVTHSNIPSSPVMSVSRLDRGRDLALEDLVSPTRFSFGSRHSSQQQQHQYDPTAPAGFSSAAPTTSGQDWRSAPTFPLLSTAGELAQLDIATGVEDRFLEMAGALGEGQAVASVLGTLKKMIRQLKTEKKVSEKATQKLQKELKKAQRDLERSRKANEKLSRTDHATQSSSHPKPGRADKGEEAESIIAQQEKDKIARNMVAFQKRIDALEMQKAELQMREQIRAKEEADLLLLVDSDDDSEQGEGSSESGSEIGSESVESDAANHAKYDKNPRQIRSVCSDSEHSVMQRPLGERGAGVSRRSPTKAPLASSSRAASRKFREEQESSGASRTRTKSRRTNAHSKSTQYQEPRQVVEKVEEVVHIHHHVYYGDDDQRDDPSPTRRSRSMDGSRRSAAANLRNLTHSEYAEPSDGQYHTRLGTGVEAEDLPRRQPPRQNPMPHRVAELPHIPLDRDTHTFWNQRTHHGPMAVPQQNQAFAQPFQRSQFIYDDLTRPETEQLPIPQRARAVTIVDGGEENPRYGAAASRAFTLSQGAAFHELGIPLSNSASAKQKKISINLRRILSLLKTHDPKRCTVCCNGGDSQDHERRHQEHVRKSLSMLRIDGKPVRIRQRRQDAESGSLSRTATQPHLPRRTIAALASPEDSGSSFSTESSSDSNDAQDLNNGESQELPYPRRQLSFTAATTTPQKSGLTRNAESSVASEQKLHIVLRELEEEVRHLRKSYSELHHDLEIIGQKSVGDADLDVKGKGRSLNGGSSSTTAAISTEASATETAAAAAEQRRQQKKLIREQLLKVVDSLGEKTDEIMRLQEQQEQRLHSSNKKTPPRSVQCLRTSTSGARNDTKRSDKDRREKNDRNDDTTTATSTRDIDNEHDAHEQEEQQANAEQDKEQGTDTSDSQGTARPRQRHPDHQGKASRVEEGKGRRSQSKEPEGYRHRLANGFRVPKLH